MPSAYVRFPWKPALVGVALGALFAGPASAQTDLSVAVAPWEADGAEPALAPGSPPELPSERRGDPPYEGALWASGHWDWDGDQWLWAAGGWIAPMPGYDFVNGYWQPVAGGWRWVTGGWAPRGSTEVALPVSVVAAEPAAPEAPPEPTAEEVPETPGTTYVWAPGYWYWGDAGWWWVAGAWLLPPRPGFVFVSPRWARRGGTYVFVGGGWAAARYRHRVVVPVHRHSRLLGRRGQRGQLGHVVSPRSRGGTRPSGHRPAVQGRKPDQRGRGSIVNRTRPSVRRNRSTHGREARPAAVRRETPGRRWVPAPGNGGDARAQRRKRGAGSGEGRSRSTGEAEAPRRRSGGRRSR